MSAVVCERRKHMLVVGRRWPNDDLRKEESAKSI